MKQYRYKDVKQISKSGIFFGDGFQLLFEECNEEWSKEKGISRSDRCCVAERNVLAKPPYFLFYTKERLKLVFDTKGIFSQRRNETQFHHLQIVLNNFGFSTFDLT